MRNHSQGKYTHYRSGRYAFTNRQLGNVKACGTEGEHLHLISKKPKKVG